MNEHGTGLSTVNAGGAPPPRTGKAAPRPEEAADKLPADAINVKVQATASTSPRRHVVVVAVLDGTDPADLHPELADGRRAHLLTDDGVSPVRLFCAAGVPVGPCCEVLDPAVELHRSPHCPLVRSASGALGGRS